MEDQRPQAIWDQGLDFSGVDLMGNSVQSIISTLGTAGVSLSPVITPDGQK